jgi:hypothetical protein
MSRRGSFVVILLDPILSPFTSYSSNVMFLISDDVIINSIVGTSEGRIFMGGSDCCVYEIRYQVRTLSPSLLHFIHTHPKDQGWFSRPSKINHSRSRVSYLVPSAVQALVGLRETESILEMAVDAPRRVLIVRCTETLKVGVLLFQYHFIHPFLFFAIRFVTFVCRYANFLDVHV